MSDGGAPLCRTEVRPRVGDTSGWTLELREARRSPKEKSTRGGLDFKVEKSTKKSKTSKSEHYTHPNYQMTAFCVHFPRMNLIRNASERNPQSMNIPNHTPSTPSPNVPPRR